MIVHVRRVCLGAIAGALSTLLLLSAGATDAGAQATGSVHGRVTDEAGGRPLANVTVAVVGTSRGALTDASGDYTISGVPAGTHTVRAQFLGFAAVSHSVTVAVGQAATVNFALAAVATALDEVVVTGQPGATRRREIGARASQRLT